MKSVRSHALLSLACLGLAVAQGTTVARAANAVGEQAQAPEQVTEIIVTAQRRSESMMKVPVSMTAIGDEAVKDLQITQPIDLVGHVAGLQAANTSGDGFPIYSIRGISLNDYSPNQSAPVAVYTDGVFASGAVFMANQAFDLQRVEVLRGPQGTLYGRNATGGAINFITVKPDFTTKGYLTARVGNFGRYELEGAFQAALTDQLAVRAAVNYAKADGYVRDTITGERFGGSDVSGGRLTLVYKPGDSFEATLRASTGRYGPAPGALATRGAGLGYGGGTYAPGSGVPLARIPAVPAGFDFFGSNATDNATTHAVADPRLGSSSNDGRTDQASLELLWHLAPTVDLVSITSYGRGQFGLREDADQTPLNIMSDGGRNKGHQFAEDLRVQSAGDNRFNYIAGLYYSRDHIDWSYRYLYFTDVDINGDGLLDSNDCLTSFFAGCIYANSFKQDRTSTAAYGDGTLALNDVFSLRAGLRYTRDKLDVSDFNAQVLGSDLVPLFNTIPGSATDINAVAAPIGKAWSTATGRIGLDIHLPQGLLAYGTLSTGYRGGSFNAQAYFGPGELSIANPEKLSALELGVKGHALDRRLTFTAEAFYYRYRDQQTINVDPATFLQTEVNLARSHIYGGELEATWQAADVLRFGVNVSVLRSAVDEATVSGVNLAGNELVLAPKLSGSANLDWTAYQGASGKLKAFLEASYIGRQWMDLYDTASIAAGGHAVVNARLGYEFSFVPLSVGLWGKNLANKSYLASAVDVPSFGFQYLRYGKPRTFGAELSYRF